MSDDELKALVLEAMKVPPTDDFHYPLAPNQLRHFAALVAAAEREACAELADRMDCFYGVMFADAIRARGQG